MWSNGLLWLTLAGLAAYVPHTGTLRKAACRMPPFPAGPHPRLLRLEQTGARGEAGAAPLWWLHAARLVWAPVGVAP